MAKFKEPVVHHNLVLVHCQTPAVLQETLAQLDIDEVPHQQLGARTLLVPKTHLETVIDKLHDIGVFPSIVGDPALPKPEEEVTEDGSEGEVDDA